MFNPLYTSCESAEIISVFIALAQSTASDVFPVAVAPQIINTRFNALYLPLEHLLDFVFSQLHADGATVRTL